MLYKHEPIIHQSQPTMMSCIATCMAMLIKEDAVYVDQEFSNAYTEGSSDVPAYLGMFGIRCIPHLSAGMHDISAFKVYLATVPSLQLPGLFHQIIIDTRFGQVSVYDPCKGIPNKQWYTFEVDRDKIDAFAYPLRSYIIDYEIILPVDVSYEQSKQSIL